MTALPLVEAERLTKSFAGGGLLHRGPGVQAVSGIDLAVSRAEIVGLVGESGSGKSTIGRLLLGLIPATSGRVLYGRRDLTNFRGREQRGLRRHMQLVFQDPYSSLDPRRTVGSQIADGLAIHRLRPRSERAGRVAELIEQTGLDRSHAARYPHQFSGGQRQRIAIARALATEPDFLVADEPVSSLDVSVQAQVLKLLSDLRRELGLAILFISHDLSAIRHLCDRVLVLYLGRVMEEGPVAAVFSRPGHPYTAALLSAVPGMEPGRRRDRIVLAGDPPSPANPPSGCVFRTRCPFAIAPCAEISPPRAAVGEAGHWAACIRVGPDPVGGSIAPELMKLRPSASQPQPVS